MFSPTRIIVHLSGHKEKPKKLEQIGLKEIRARDCGQGFKETNFHYIIRTSGTRQIGRKDTEHGWHTPGHDDDALGVVIIGTEINESQQAELNWLAEHYNLPLVYAKDLKRTRKKKDADSEGTDPSPSA